MKTYLHILMVGAAMMWCGVSHAGPPESGTGIPSARIETHGRDAHATTKLAPVQNKMDNARSLMFRPPSVIQPAGPLLNEVHNHSPAPAVIGGPAGAKIKTTGAINGTTLNRKP